MTVEERIEKTNAKLTDANATALDRDNFASLRVGYDNIRLIDVLLDGKPATAIVTVGVVEGTDNVVINPMFISAEGLYDRLTLPDGSKCNGNSLSDAQRG